MDYYDDDTLWIVGGKLKIGDMHRGGMSPTVLDRPRAGQQKILFLMAGDSFINQVR